MNYADSGYSMRNGSVDMYFNPYIVPGIPNDKR